MRHLQPMGRPSQLVRWSQSTRVRRWNAEDNRIILESFENRLISFPTKCLLNRCFSCSQWISTTQLKTLLSTIAIAFTLLRSSPNFISILWLPYRYHLLVCILPSSHLLTNSPFSKIKIKTLLKAKRYWYSLSIVFWTFYLFVQYRHVFQHLQSCGSSPGSLDRRTSCPCCFNRSQPVCFSCPLPIRVWI